MLTFIFEYEIIRDKYFIVSPHIQQESIYLMMTCVDEHHPNSAIVQLVRILGPHPSDPGSSPGGGSMNQEEVKTR